MAKMKRKSRADGESVDLLQKAEQTSLAGNVDEAILLYRKALDFAGKQDHAVKAKAMRSLGNLWWRKGKPRKALDYFNRSLAISKSARDLSGVAQAYNCIGTVYFDSGKWPTVERYFTRALNAAERSGDLKLTAHLYNNLGAMWNIRGYGDRAISFYRKAEQIYRKLKDKRGLARIHNNLGLTYRDRSDWKEAAKHYQECARLSKECADRSLWANCTLNYVQVLIELSNYAKARERCDEAFEVLIRMGEVAGIAEAMMLNGMIYTRKGKLAIAEKQFAESVMINENQGNLLGKAECYKEMALMYKIWGNRSRTLEYLDKAYRVFKTLKAKKYLREIENQVAALGAA